MTPVSSSDLEEILSAGADRTRVVRGVAVRDWLIYGAGRCGREWAKLLATDGRRVHGFVDRQAMGDGTLPVYRIGECPEDLKRQCAVLLAVHNPGVDVASVIAALRDEEFQDVWLLQDLIDEWPAAANFWLAASAETLPFVEAIHAAFLGLADDASRALFAALLDQRLNSQVAKVPVGRADEHYLPTDLPSAPMPMRFIDCGAYTGDTIASFRRQGLQFEELAAFEPDPAQYRQLCTEVAREKAYVFPCGVWDEMTQLRFVADGSAGHIAAHGDITVQTVALDQALPNFTPDYIKMDIEGAEAKALNGARGIITRSRPRLAISTYHKPRDLWELQLLIHEWDLDYRFHLRSHGCNGFETVLYGLPQ